MDGDYVTWGIQPNCQDICRAVGVCKQGKLQWIPGEVSIAHELVITRKHTIVWS